VTGAYVLAGDDRAGREAERERLELVQRYHDPLSVAALEAAGVDAGWRVWEVGAGAGSIARWLAERVGDGGEVVATDLDPSAVAALGLPHVRALRHDVLADPPPAEGLDLVHVRLVLLHLPRRAEAVARMAAALRPGGVLVAGEIDFAGHAPVTPSAAWERVWRAFAETVSAAGWDPEVGGRLPALLEAAGLDGVEGRALGGYVRGGSLRCRLQRLTFERLRGAMTADGRCAGADLDEVGRLLLDPAAAFRAPTAWTVWGRRPGGPGA
jgi:SAM-dependent methyltransferase